MRQELQGYNQKDHSRNVLQEQLMHRKSQYGIQHYFFFFAAVFLGFAFLTSVFFTTFFLATIFLSLQLLSLNAHHINIRFHLIKNLHIIIKMHVIQNNCRQ